MQRATAMDPPSANSLTMRPKAQTVRIGTSSHKIDYITQAQMF